MYAPQDQEALTAEVFRLKGVLDKRPRARSEVHAALEKLQSLSPLPTSVLIHTKVGVSVTQASKDSEVDEIARKSARELVQRWKDTYRKQQEELNTLPPQKKVRVDPSSESQPRRDAPAHSAGSSPAQSNPSSESLSRRLAPTQSARSSPAQRNPAAQASTAAAGNDERRLALRRGGDQAVLREAESYLKSHNRRASMQELNVHLARIWTGSLLVVIESNSAQRRGPDDPPTVNKQFVQRHSDILELVEKRKSTAGSRKKGGGKRTKGRGKGYLATTFDSKPLAGKRHGQCQHAQ